MKQSEIDSSTNTEGGERQRLPDSYALRNCCKSLPCFFLNGLINKQYDLQQFKSTKQSQGL